MTAQRMTREAQNDSEANDMRSINDSEANDARSANDSEANWCSKIQNTLCY
jgi:hypothetical protein